MKIYIVKVASCHDYEEDNYTEGAYYRKEQAQSSFDKLVKEAKENADDGTIISIDTDSRFESYGNESAAKDHCYINLEEIEMSTGRTPQDRLDTLQSAVNALEQELKNRALQEINKILDSFKTNELDFSLLTDTSEDDGTLDYDEAQENKISITQYGKYGMTWEVYPIGIRRKDNILEFICINDEDARNNCTLRKEEMESYDVYRIAWLLLEYLEVPEKQNLTVTETAGVSKVKMPL